MKLQPGDIIEIKTSSGFAYVQVTHIHPSYPEVVRSLAGRYDRRPADLDALAESPSLFTAMLPLGNAIENKRLSGTRIGRAAIPETCKAFPTFRMPIRDRKGGIAYWWLWDGDGLQPAGNLNEDQSALPLREVMPVGDFLAKLEVKRAD